VIQKRLLVFAYSELGHACLKFLIDRGEKIVGVYTHEDTSTETIWFPSVKRLCTEFDVPVSTAEDLKSHAAQNILFGLKPDVILSFYYRNMIPKAVFEKAHLGAFNMHGSLLPKYRGRAPINWAVLKGEKETGATLHWMVDKADAGDIVDQEAVPIQLDDTAAIVQAHVTEAAVKVLARQIDNLKLGMAPRRPQDSVKASLFGRRTPQDGQIDWSKSAQATHNLVRAITHPFPGAFADVIGHKTFIWKTKPVDNVFKDTGSGSLVFQDNRLFIVCGDGRTLEALRIQREGEDELDGTQFAEKYLVS